LQTTLACTHALKQSRLITSSVKYHLIFLQTSQMSGCLEPGLDSGNEIFEVKVSISFKISMRIYLDGRAEHAPPLKR
jgi:hypothetical protein